MPSDSPAANAQSAFSGLLRPRAPEAGWAAPSPSRHAREEARAGLYVHVPFCAVRCTYCDFSSGSLSAAAVERYLEAMAREAGLRAPSVGHLRFTSVFFGGGTPSALSARHFRRLWATLNRHFTLEPAAEVTLEANPESVRPALLEAWAEAGVNRLSMGAQSFDPRELEMLGRIHSAARPAEAVALARAHGFRRLSLDLMFGFPGHDPERWRATIEAALELDPGHLSAYCYIPEPGTPLGDAVGRGEQRLPEPEVQADMYDVLALHLGAAGYRCYETSNFCRPNEEARHNLVYWLRRPYLGLGPSAHGLWGEERYGNFYAMARWAGALEARVPPESEREVESERSLAQEIVMLGLRLAAGVDPADHSERIWLMVERRYRRAFERAQASGRLERTERGGVRIPPRFRFVADDVVARVEADAESGASAGGPGLDLDHDPVQRKGATQRLTLVRRASYL